MKPNVEYVFPNVIKRNRTTARGGIVERHSDAQQFNCCFVKLPCGFIKKRKEAILTNLKIGRTPDERAIDMLYDFTKRSDGVEYIMHSEHLRRLHWDNPEWVGNFIDMLVLIAARCGVPPVGIEIHPGGKQNKYVDLIRSVIAIRSKFGQTFGSEPFVVVENRNGQFISNGDHIASFWCELRKESGLENVAGVVLDIQQLYSACPGDFREQLRRIPRECVLGVHIHSGHMVPSLSDEIPWKHVFAWIREIRHEILMIPEVHHKSRVDATIKFCEKMLGAC